MQTLCEIGGRRRCLPEKLPANHLDLSKLAKERYCLGTFPPADDAGI